MWRWLRRLLRLKYKVDELARRLDVSLRELQTVPARYRPVLIPKKRGGTRRLDVPDASLKNLQRRINRRLLASLRTHEAATGFTPGLSVAHNAAAHVGQAVVIKMDIVDFFPSTTTARVERYFRYIGWDDETAALLTLLVTHEGGLPQGAPTSPRLSNLVNHALDARIARQVRKHHGVYTRYADDITISFRDDNPRRVRGLIQYVRAICKAHGYTVHRKHKLRICRRHQQQRVTGLVVNEKVQLPRHTRRWLRAVEHRMATTGQSSLTPEQLAGWRAYQHMIQTQARA